MIIVGILTNGELKFILVLAKGWKSKSVYKSWPGMCKLTRDSNGLSMVLLKIFIIMYFYFMNKAHVLHVLWTFYVTYFFISVYIIKNYIVKYFSIKIIFIKPFKMISQRLIFITSWRIRIIFLKNYISHFHLKINQLISIIWK